MDLQTEQRLNGLRMWNSSQQTPGETPSPDKFPRSAAVAYVVVSVFESLLMIVGNALIIAAFCRTKEIRQRKCFLLLINVAVADLLVGAIGGPLYTYILSRRSGLLWTEHPHLILKISGISALYFTYTSVVSLVVLSLERMHSIVWPLKHRMLRARSYHVMIGVTWFLAAGCTLSVAMNNFDSLQISKTLNFFNFIFASFLLLIIIISYIGIWVKIKFYNHPQHHMTSAQDRKLAISLFMVTAASITTWFAAAILLDVVCSYPVCKWWTSQSINIHVFNFATLLLSTSSLVNPVIYALRMPQFRRAVYRLVFRRTTGSIATRPRNTIGNGNQRVCTTNSTENAKATGFDTRL